MSNTEFKPLPSLDDIPSTAAQVAQDAKITNLLLTFVDFHVTEEDFQTFTTPGYTTCNLEAMVADLKHFGYDITMPKSADEYRNEVYPKLMDFHKKIGFYGLQIPVAGAAFDDDGNLFDSAIENLKLQKQIVESVGLNISAVAGMWDQDWKKCMKPHIQGAFHLGSPYYYGPFTTPFLHWPEGVRSGEEAVAWTKEYHKGFAKLLQEEIGPYAREHGVTICEEPLQRFERMPTRLQEATDLAFLADIDEFKIMIDMCHECADGGGPSVFNPLVERLAKGGKLHGAHISAVHRGKLYESWYNEQYFNEFFTPLFENGFDGEIAIETFDATDPVVDVIRINRPRFDHPIGVTMNQFIFVTNMLGPIVEKTKK